MNNIYENCICAEWDGKGWSVCGYPCPMHNKVPKKKLKEIREKQKKEIKKFMKDIRAGRVKSQPLDF